MNTRRLLLYLALNAMVSAAATLSVLWLWDRAHQPPPVAGNFTPVAPVPGGTAAAPATPGLAEVAASPTPTVYIVQSGDTLGNVALRFDVSVEAIMAANGLDNPHVLSVGQRLIIPVEGFVPATPTAAALPTNPVQPPLATATRDPTLPLPRLAIREVQSAGALQGETLVIVNSGGPVDLAGWTLRDESGHIYTFPGLTLFQDGAVNVHTAAGEDTVTDLYWGQTRAVWTSGKTVLLTDAAGNLHARYSVP